MSLRLGNRVAGSMALGGSVHRQGSLISGETQPSWLVQCKAPEAIGGGMFAINLRIGGAQCGIEGARVPRVLEQHRRRKHALMINSSHVEEDGDEETHNDTDRSRTKSTAALSLPPSPPPPPPPPPPQPHRTRGGSGGGDFVRWFLGPLVLLITGAAPALWLPSPTLFAGSVTTGLLALAGLDSTFNMGATAFLLMADAIARGKSPTRRSCPQASSPHVKSMSTIPLGYRVWSFMVNLIGLLIPVAAVTLSLKGFLHPSLDVLPAAALLGPYTLLLVVQWLAEFMVWHWQSPVWPVLPVVYQGYRVLQLTRGIELCAALSAPAWMADGLKGLVAWWVFVMGMQTMWVAWLVGTMLFQEEQMHTWNSGS